MTKRYLALARVSSREQEREGFSLEVQEQAIRQYVERQGGVIARLYRIAETASKREERKVFREMIAYAKAHAAQLAGLVFYKIDRASRNLFDYVELERLESDFGLPFLSVSQPTENTPAGRMMRRTLANMAAYYTEQQALDVKEGLARRVQEGWFIGKAPYGYRNVRRDGRGIVEVDAESAAKIRRIFHLYAYEHLTLDALGDRLASEHVVYLPSLPQFTRSKLHEILRDRAYIGEIEHRGQWYPGKHEPLVDAATFQRVQVLLGGKVYHSHALTFASERIRCGHCGHPITGECKTKKTRSGERHYVYYRCSRYNVSGHARTRVTEALLDRQILDIFDSMRIDDREVREWFVAVLHSKTRDDYKASLAKRQDLERQISSLIGQENRLLDLRLAEEISQDVFARKQTELRDRLSELKLALDVLDRSHDEMTDLASRVFELSQSLRERWVTAEPDDRRKILDIVCLNCELLDGKLSCELRKPFDVLAEGLVSSESRGERI